jgi:hypothetical protein
MRKIIILLVLILFLGISFAATFDLIKYYSDDAQSHACIAGRPGCNYFNVVTIDDSIQSTPLDKVKILGISSTTNAHVELPSQNNYDNNVYLKGDVFAGGTCEFTSAGDFCNYGAGYNCIFEISDVNNAHLSSCNVFGSRGIKFCCNVGGEIIVPPLQEGFCGLDIFDTIVKNEEVTLNFKCYQEQDINIFIFDRFGNPLNKPQSDPQPIVINCNTDLQQIDLGSSLGGFDFEVNNLYIVRADNKGCLKDIYFAIKDEVKSTNIPDNNIFSILVLISCVLFITKGFNTRKE